MESGAAPPDGGEYCNEGQPRREVGDGESREHRPGKPPQRRPVDTAKQQQARERSRRPALSGVSEGAEQISRRNCDPFNVAADRAIRRRHHEARRMDVGVEQSVVPVPKADSIGNLSRLRRDRGCEKMDAGFDIAMIQQADIFRPRSERVCRLIVWIDADCHELVIASDLKRQVVERLKKFAQSDAAHRRALEIFEHQNHGRSGEILSQGCRAAAFVDESRSQWQASSRMRTKGQVRCVGCADSCWRCRGRTYKGAGKSSGAPVLASFFIASATGMCTMPFRLSIQWYVLSHFSSSARTCRISASGSV